MDFSNLDTTRQAEEVQIMEVIHPITDEPLRHNGEPVTIMLIGAEATEIRNEMRRRSSAYAARLNKRRGSIPVEEQVRIASELCAKATKGWDNVYENGQPVEFSEDNAIMMYSKYTWLREQVDTFINDRANFYKA